MPDRVMGIRKQLSLRNEILGERLTNLLPKVMNAHDIDLWIVAAREHNEDPVMYSMLPAPMMSARRTTVLLFYKQPNGEIERMCLSRKNGGLDKYYKNVWIHQKGSDWLFDTILMPDRDVADVQDGSTEEEQFECVGRIVRERNPSRIGLNYSDRTAFGDGISHSLYLEIEQALGPDLSRKIVSAEELCVQWLETRLDREIELYRSIAGAAHAIIRSGFSNLVVKPEITTNRDIEYWMMEEGERRGFSNWFNAIVTIRRRGENIGKEETVRRGDILHCDVGLRCMGYHFDAQANAYVMRIGENQVPDGIEKLYDQGRTAHRLLAGEFVEGRMGDEILRETLKKVGEQGIRAMIYAHPIGLHGHAAGPNIGRVDNQRSIEGTGSHILREKTLHAMELCVIGNIPEWDGREAILGFETEAVFENGTVSFFYPQDDLYVII